MKQQELLNRLRDELTHVVAQTEGNAAMGLTDHNKIAVDTYFPRAHLIECLRTLQADFSTVAINLRITTMQGGERLVLDGTCALAVTITDVP